MNKELVIDMGYATTTIAEKGKGIILKEPSLIIATKQKGKLKLIASGNEAKRLIRSREKRVVGAVPIYPVKEGAIDNAEAATLMIKDFLLRAYGKSILAPKVDAVVTISCGASVVERKNYENVLTEAGVKNIVLVETPLAVNALLPADNNLIVVGGASNSEVAIVSESGIVTGCSVNMAGLAMDNNICTLLSDNYRLGIRPHKAEELRCKIGSLADKQLISADVVGKDLIDNSTRKLEITSDEIMPAVLSVINSLSDVIENVSMMCPETMIMDIFNAGITFCGGLANTYGISKFMSDKLKISVNVLKNPEDSVALGALKLMEDRDKMYSMLSIKS